MIKGNERRVYLSVDSAHTSLSWLAGEQSNSFNRSLETIDVTDKDGAWAEFIAGRKSATADVTVTLDDTASAEQHKLLQALNAGTTVYVFVGKIGEPNTPEEGDFFQALVTAINDSNEKDNVASRQISLQATGEVEHFPSLA